MDKKRWPRQFGGGSCMKSPVASCVTWWIQPGGSCMKSPVASYVTWWIQPGGSCMKSPGGHVWPDGYNQEDHAWSHQWRHMWPDGYNQEDHAWSHQWHHMWPDGYNQEDHAWSHQGVMCDLMDTTRRIMHEVTRGSCVTWWIQPGGSCMKSAGGHVWPDGYNQEDHAWSQQGVMCDLMDTTRRIMHEVSRGSCVTWWIQPGGSCMKSAGGHIRAANIGFKKRGALRRAHPTNKFQAQWGVIAKRNEGRLDNFQNLDCNCCNPCNSVNKICSFI